MHVLLQISWIFQNPLNIFYWNSFEGSYGQNPQKSEIRKYAILSQPRYLTFFEDEIFQFFSCLYGSKVPKWNFAHTVLLKKAKNIRKSPKNTFFTAPWLRTTLLNDPVHIFSIVNLPELEFQVIWFGKTNLVNWSNSPCFIC